MTTIIKPAKPKSRKAKRGGRPKAAKTRDHWISFRLTAEEHFQLISKAQRSGMVVGDYARSRALRGIARAKKQPNELPDLFGDNTRDMFHELRKQGTLLNQIAKHCNTHQVPPPLEFVALADTITFLWRKLAP